MQFSEGQTVVHPRHGTATITGFEEREFDGETLRYVVMRKEQDQLTVRIPEQAWDEIGLRSIVGPDEVETVFEILGDEPTLAKGSWRKRHARNERRLQSGEAEELAVSLRELAARDHQRDDGLSPSDKNLRDTIRDRLVSELAAALDDDRETVVRRIDETLTGMVETYMHDEEPASA